MSGFLPPILSSLYERNQEATVYIGNLDLRVTEDILWELFVQCGPVLNVHIPRDKITLQHPEVSGFFPCAEGAGYAGGIVSAAIDGEKCALKIAEQLNQ